MKLVSAKGAKLNVVIDYQVEVRFTPNGERLATWYGIGYSGIRFELWTDCPGYCKPGEHVKCDSVNDLTELPNNAVITVSGSAKERTYQTPFDGPKKITVFTVDGWVSAS